MSLELHHRVALSEGPSRNCGLQTGDVATLIDVVDHPGSGPRGCVLEIVNALGDAIVRDSVRDCDLAASRG